jgi:PKD repeat protein
VAVDANDRIYVGNKNSGNVEVYDADLNLLFKLGTGDGEFTQPGAIAIESSGNIYVADSGEDQIKVYHPDGSVNFTFGSTGIGNGEFIFPTGIAIDETAGEIIVADRQLITDAYGGQIQGARVQVLAMNGVFKRSFGEYGVGEGLMSRPVGVAVDGEGRIYVADSYQNVVHVFDGSDGTSLGTIYNTGTPMRTPLHLVYGGSNRLFVTSLNTGRLEIFGLNSYTNMQTSPLSLSFEGEEYGADPASQSVTIANNGSGTLDWTAATDDGWINLSAASGTTAVSGTSGLDIGVSLSGLSAGVYTGYVTIGSGTTATDIVTIQLTISALPQLTADVGGPYSGVEGTGVVLDGSGSTGSISLYEWDIDNDGTYEYSTASSTQIHTFTQSGAYTVRLRVTDLSGNTSEATVSADISDSLPTAGFTADPTNGSGPLTVNFTNTSTGYDGPLTYAWDFDGDWASDSELENPTYVFAAAGTYTVNMAVTDSDGDTFILSRTNYITVTSGSGLEGCANSPIKSGVSYYSTMQGAYNAAINREVIKLHGQTMSSEFLTVSRGVTVTIKGGYNCDYTGTSGMTTINGNITVTAGALILEETLKLLKDSAPYL